MKSTGNKLFKLKNEETPQNQAAKDSIQTFENNSVRESQGNQSEYFNRKSENGHDSYMRVLESIPSQI